jgi:Ca2+-binding EF-hand superfamily protein
MSHKLWRDPAVAVVVWLTSAASALAQPAPVPAPAEQWLARSIAPGLALSRYLEQRRTEFRSLDFDHDGVLTTADREGFLVRAAASARAISIQQIIEADLDGDGVVTREEVVKAATARAGHAPSEGEALRRKRIDDAVAERMKADLDGNGVIDPAEMIAYAKQSAALMRPNPNVDLEAALSLAVDGKTTLAAYEEAAERVFRVVDTDGDGLVSKEEFEAYRRRATPRPATPDPRQTRETECTMPPVPAGAKVVLVGTNGGTGVSTVALGSQDAVTSAARVTIEDGVEPLYIGLVSAMPLIWQLDGAVERIAKVVLVASGGAYYRKPPPGIAAGVTGLAREIAAFASRPDCIKSFSDRPTIDSTLAAGAVRRRTGHEPDAVVPLDGAEHVWLPSGRSETSYERPRDVKTMQIERSTTQLTAAGVREKFERMYPAGVVQIDPASVIGGQSVEPYAVLPRGAGLLQLLDEGKLELGRGQEFVVRAKIRYPAGLDSSYRFRIPSGVAHPDGDPGQACPIFEDGAGPPPRPPCS